MTTPATKPATAKSEAHSASSTAPKARLLLACSSKR